MVAPYYQDSSCTIYHGDCRDILPHLEPVDLVLTDPPYGMSFRSNHRTKKHLPIHGDDFLPLDLIELSIMKASAAAYVFCRWSNLKELPDPTSVIVWVKNNWSMGDLDHEHAKQWEACCFYRKEKHRWSERGRPSDIIRAERTGNDLHPTEKPIKIFHWLISHNVGETILDPFMGSGTTLVAAKNLGRKAIGIEIEEKYCEIAVKRLRQEVLAL